MVAVKGVRVKGCTNACARSSDTSCPNLRALGGEEPLLVTKNEIMNTPLERCFQEFVFVSSLQNTKN